MVVDATLTHCGPRELVLMLPGLPEARLCAGPTLPRLRAFEKLTARADRIEGGDGPPLVMLVRLLPQLAGAEPLAAGPLSRLADTGTRDDAWWARADPVHLAPVRDHLRLLAGDALTMAEAEALAASCNRALADHGLELETPLPDRWYLCSRRALHFTVSEPARIVGEDVFPAQPHGPDGAFVRRVLTELQMVLHDHPVNRARERAGKLSTNSLWVWGGGVLPASFPAQILPALRSDDAVLRGLWRYAGAAAEVLPGTLVPAPGLIVTRSCEVAARAGDPTHCAALLERIEEQWLQPLLAGLETAAIECVRMLLGRGGTYTLDRRGLRRWWRRSKAPE